MAGVAGLAPKVRVRILSIRFNVAGVAGLAWSVSDNESCHLIFITKKWQGLQDSNLRHLVLETSALPTELNPYITNFTTKNNPHQGDYFSVSSL